MQLGLICQLHEAAGRNTPLNEYMKIALPAVSTKHLELVFDSLTRLLGVYFWASVSDEVSELMIEYGKPALKQSKWSSGKNFWIIEFQVSSGARKPMLNQIVNTILRKHESVTYFRIKPQGWYVKRVFSTTLKRRKLWKDSFRNQVLPSLTSNEKILHQRKHSFLKAAIVGHCLMLFSESPSLSKYPLKNAINVVRLFFGMRQIKLYFDENGKAVGCLMWAWISESTAIRLKYESPQSIHPTEWNEGETLCLCELTWNGRITTAMEQDISGALFQNEQRVLWYGRTEGDKDSTIHELNTGQLPDFYSSILNVSKGKVSCFFDS